MHASEFEKVESLHFVYFVCEKLKLFLYSLYTVGKIGDEKHGGGEEAHMRQLCIYISS